MRSALVIGLGRFGRYLCNALIAQNNEVMIIDKDEALVTPLMNDVTDAKIADCTDESVIRSLGVSNFDCCFVCIGSDLASSLLVTTLLRDNGARTIIAKASTQIHARLLKRTGADQVIFPEKESAERLAAHVTRRNIFDCIPLTEEFAIYEIPPLPQWIGQSVVGLELRTRWNINLLAVKEGDTLRPMPGINYVFTGHEHLLVLAAKADMDKLVKKLD